MTTWGSSRDHRRYAVSAPSTSRRKCSCGCNRRATHVGMANGMALVMGCDLSIRRWVKTETLVVRREVKT